LPASCDIGIVPRVDRPLDLRRTTLNMTGAMTVAARVDRGETT